MVGSQLDNAGGGSVGHIRVLPAARTAIWRPSAAEFSEGE
jgi:hypothetical protein